MKEYTMKLIEIDPTKKYMFSIYYEDGSPINQNDLEEVKHVVNDWLENRIEGFLLIPYKLEITQA